jgi:hypothetical protein
MAEEETPADTRPTDGTCSQWVGAELRYCRAAGGVRYFVNGFRCGEHGPTPAAVAGRGEPVAGPGAGRNRGEGER